ncbi:LOW QUALITY PROTEIN: hypothetical protein V1478_001279 [Vespula squamosa]|uniref:Uncharacterized protein n=1 Tax=Vespula squamosa TaxID=30214 RepID=A0ABD2C111_VESSQ
METDRLVLFKCLPNALNRRTNRTKNICLQSFSISKISRREFVVENRSRLRQTLLLANIQGVTVYAQRKREESVIDAIEEQNPVDLESRRRGGNSRRGSDRCPDGTRGIVLDSSTFSKFSTFLFLRHRWTIRLLRDRLSATFARLSYTV